MLMPRIFGENLFDDFFNFPDFSRMENQIGRELYGHRAGELMKVDVKDTDNGYEMYIDLPGFKKEDISAKLENGYLTVSASKGLDKDEKDEETGRYIRRERFSGSCQRSFYVGTQVKQEEIKAGFEHGVLKLMIPKEQPRLENPNGNFIQIEG